MGCIENFIVSCNKIKVLLCHIWPPGCSFPADTRVNRWMTDLRLKCLHYAIEINVFTLAVLVHTHNLLSSPRVQSTPTGRPTGPWTTLGPFPLPRGPHSEPAAQRPSPRPRDAAPPAVWFVSSLPHCVSMALTHSSHSCFCRS